jgi:fucokinase
MGKIFSPVDLSSLVLRLEQLLTSGGGWQDQIGGGIPGVKLTSCNPGLPLTLLPPERIILADDEILSDRLVLVFTGKARLARTLLQGFSRLMCDVLIHIRCMFIMVLSVL